MLTKLRLRLIVIQDKVKKMNLEAEKNRKFQTLEVWHLATCLINYSRSINA